MPLNPKSRLIPLLWSLLLAKCFCMEYLVERYAVPINSAVYVWALSLTMAFIASLLYLNFKISRSFVHHLATWPRILLILSGCGMAALTTWALLSHQLGALTPKLALAVAANYAVYAQVQKSRSFWLSATGWTGTSLLIHSMDPISRIGIFAAAILIFSTLPLLWQQITQRRDIKAAIRALHDHSDHNPEKT